ncbi:MAG: acetyl-CoA carboxylase carboxyl transferase subunit alpha [Clostridia bacterium]|nr:acetyl-CoA carboxylase carboxyl transferase subunit alpha [Clostridia bacterium]
MAAKADNKKTAPAKQAAAKQAVAKKATEKERTPYDIVLMSRDKNRPTAVKYIERIVEGFIELKGDRGFADDPAIVGGIGRIDGMPVTVIGIEKGVDTADKLQHNFGCTSPEGYRKALRLMRQAEKFGRPVLNFVDTSGAACGIGAEERGEAEAIAVNLREMAQLGVPILSIFIGEGGSGGALGLAVADEVWITETSTYSVISPEGCASILYKDPSKVKEAADALRLTAPELYKRGAVERVIEEKEFGDAFFAQLKQDIAAFFREKNGIAKEERTQARYARFRAF